MRFRYFLPFIVMLLMAGSIFAQQATNREMALVSQNQWTAIRGSGSIEDHPLPDQFSHLRLYTPSRGVGFVIITDQKAAYPVVAYSAESEWNDSIGPQLYWWLMKQQSLLEYIVSEKVAPTKDIENVWTKWTTGGSMVIANMVSPLLHSAWSQSPRYNNYCPIDNQSSSGHALVGCVATAMAQVMKYWQYPSHGIGSNVYNHELYGLIEADFGNATYQWDLMPYQLDSASLMEQIDACALLCYHCGVSVNMHYGVHASGSYVVNYGNNMPSAETALKRYFGYNPSLEGVYRQLCSDQQWVRIVKEELSEGRPVIYSGVDVEIQGGHAFVCDGYDNNGYFHFDWGWNGYANGYYLLESLNPAGYIFNDQEDCLIGVEPSGRLRTSEKRYTCSADANDVVVTVYSSTSDSAQWHLINLPSWITSSQQSGDGNGSITEVSLHVEPNTTGMSRETDLCFVQNGDTVRNSLAQFGCFNDAMCDLEVYMYDVYGDGYQFNKLIFTQTDGTEYATVSLPNGFDTVVTVGVCNQELVLNWMEGFFSSEDGFVVTNGSGDTIAYHEAGEDYPTQEVCRISSPCAGVCMPPSLEVSNPMPHDVVSVAIQSSNTNEDYIFYLLGSDNEYSINSLGCWIDTILVHGTMVDIRIDDLSDYGNYILYAVSVCGEGDYSSKSSPQTFTFIPQTGVVAVESHIAVYPNPVRRQLHVDADGLKMVEIYDMMGGKILETMSSLIDVSSFVTNTYWLRITTEQGVVFRKIVVK